MHIIVVYGLLDDIQTKINSKDRPGKFYARGGGAASSYHCTKKLNWVLLNQLDMYQCQDVVHSMFIKQRTTMEEEEYEKLKTSISNLLPDTGRRYFEKNWWSIPDLWAFSKNEAVAQIMPSRTIKKSRCSSISKEVFLSQ